MADYPNGGYFASVSFRCRVAGHFAIPMCLNQGRHLNGGDRMAKADDEPLLFVESVMRFGNEVRRLKKPRDVIEALDKVCRNYHRLRVLGAWYLPRRYTNFAAWVEGKTLFLHSHMPRDFWPRYEEAVRINGGSALGQLARQESAPFTVTEAMRKLQTTGDEHWIFAFLREYGLRDGLYCPFRKWAVLYYTGSLLTDLPESGRGMLYMVANQAVGRLRGAREKPPTI